MRFSALLPLLAGALLVTGASAGEPRTVPLPRDKKPKPAPVAAAQTCSLGGGAFTGTRVPGTEVCVKAGGFVRWQASGVR